MPTNFPTSLDSLTNPVGSDPTTNPDHAAQHANANDAIEALEAKVGINASAVSTSLDNQMEVHAHTASADDGGAIAHSNLTGLTSGDPHTQYQLRSEEDVASGYVGLTASSAASIAGGITSGTSSLTTTALATVMSSAAARIHISMAQGSATWALWLGTETIPYLYVGGNGATSQYFWRANWNATADPANTFKSASGTAGQVVLAILGAASQTANLTEWRDNTPTTVLSVGPTGWMDFPSQAAPANPAAGTRRLFTNTATGELSVRTSAGTTVSLETGGGGGGGAPTGVDYLVGTADATLTNEIVVGTTPGGELGGTWASPTVDSTHAGSTHHTQSHDHSAAGDGTALVPESVEITGGPLAYRGDISPAQITANTDNYAPTGLADAIRLRLSTDASRNLTGLTGGADGRVIIIENIGTNPLVLQHDVTSTAANRFFCPGATDLTITAKSSVYLVYDSTDSRWYVMGGGGGGSAGQFNANIGDGSSTSITVTHNLATTAVVVFVYKNSTGAQIMPDVVILNTTQIRLDFAVAPSSGEHKVIVIGGAAPVLGPLSTDVLWDAAGDMVAATGVDTAARVPIGLEGQVLTVDTAQSTKVSWKSVRVITFNSASLPGSGDQMPELFADKNMTIEYVQAASANRTADITVDVKKGGTSIFPSATKPNTGTGTGSHLGTRRVPDTTSVAQGDRLTMSFSGADFSKPDKIIVYIGVR